MQVHVAGQKATALTLPIYHLKRPFVADAFHHHVDLSLGDLDAYASAKHRGHRSSVAHQQRLPPCAPEVDLKQKQSLGEADEEVVPGHEILWHRGLGPDHPGGVPQAFGPTRGWREEVKSDPYDQGVDLVVRGYLKLTEDPSELSLGEEEIVGPLEPRSFGDFGHRGLQRDPSKERPEPCILGWEVRAAQEAYEESAAGGADPRAALTTPASCLAVGQDHKSGRRPLPSEFARQFVSASYFAEMDEPEAQRSESLP